MAEFRRLKDVKVGLINLTRGKFAGTVPLFKPPPPPPLTIRFKQQYLSHRTLDIPTLMVGDTSNDLYQTRVILWSYFNIYWFIISWCYLSRDGDHNDGWGGEPYYCLVTTTHHNTTDNGWAGIFQYL